MVIVIQQSNFQFLLQELNLLSLSDDFNEKAYLIIDEFDDYFKEQKMLYQRITKSLRPVPTFLRMKFIIKMFYAVCKFNKLKRQKSLAMKVEHSSPSLFFPPKLLLRENEEVLPPKVSEIDVDEKIYFLNFMTFEQFAILQASKSLAKCN
jgi:hypothetical protein